MDNWGTKEEGTDLLNQSCVHCYYWAALQGAVLQCVTVCYSVLRCVTVCYSVLLCVTVCYCVTVARKFTEKVVCSFHRLFILTGCVTVTVCYSVLLYYRRLAGVTVSFSLVSTTQVTILADR